MLQRLAKKKKEIIVSQFYSFEYETWSHEAKIYINKFITSMFKLMLCKRYSYDSFVYCLVETFTEIYGVLWKRLTVLRSVFGVLRNWAIVSGNVFKQLGETVTLACQTYK